MTDFAAGDINGAATNRARHVAPRREYYIYFGIIFLATLPLACLTWLLTSVRRMEIPAKGPLARAWTQARIITPQIFSA